MARNKLVAPFVKWVGGKRQIMPVINTHLPKLITRYYEPFLGGGAVLFFLQPQNAVINDANEDLINVYEVIKDNLAELVENLKTHRNEEDYFYSLRSLDRTPQFLSLSKVERASRFIFLNKTCFNGLYRVNSSGEFNSPFGRYKNPNIVNEPVLKAVHRYLNSSNISIFSGDYVNILNQAEVDANSFVYLDPPYHPVSDTSNFTGYIKGGWGEEEQVRLKNACDRLNEAGVKFLLSNSATPFIEELYSGYRIHKVQATRLVNSNADKRGEIDEFLIKNYG